ncbi:hypothetical protein ES708_10254 [subsurface metagenome]
MPTKRMIAIIVIGAIAIAAIVNKLDTGFVLGLVGTIAAIAAQTAAQARTKK